MLQNNISQQCNSDDINIEINNAINDKSNTVQFYLGTVLDSRHII